MWSALNRVNYFAKRVAVLHVYVRILQMSTSPDARFRPTSTADNEAACSDEARLSAASITAQCVHISLCECVGLAITALEYCNADPSIPRLSKRWRLIESRDLSHRSFIIDRQCC